MFIKFSFHCIIISFKNTYPRQGYLNNLVISIFHTFPLCAFYLTEVSTHQLTAINYQSVALLSLLKNIKQNQKKKKKKRKREIAYSHFQTLSVYKLCWFISPKCIRKEPLPTTATKKSTQQGNHSQRFYFQNPN